MRLHLHDGTASGVVRLPDDSEAFVSSLVIGEIVNVTGRVRARGDEPPEVVARSLADIQRAASLPDAAGEAAGTPQAGTWTEPVSSELSIGAAGELDAALTVAATHAGLPLPLLAVIAAILVGGVASLVGGTAFILWRRRTTPQDQAPQLPVPMGR